jgi:hypothetical protein
MIDLIEVRIPTSVDGEVRWHVVRGEQIQPGLAITPALRHDGTLAGTWSVTHVASGYAAASAASCIDCARKFAAELAAADWTQSREAIVASADVASLVRDHRNLVDTCNSEWGCAA